MTEAENRYWFRSTLFDLEPGEDSETNPGLYGRQLANWLRDRFRSLGYSVEDVIPEDFGWCVMCQRDPYMLWVGCVSVPDDEDYGSDDCPPSKENVLWQVMAVAEVPFFKRLFGGIDANAGLAKLDSDLRRTLEREAGIVMVDEA